MLKNASELLSLSVTLGGFCTQTQINFDTVSKEIVDDLTCDQKEADARLFLQAATASSCCSNNLILSPDTDVASISIGLNQASDANLYIVIGAKR